MKRLNVSLITIIIAVSSIYFLFLKFNIEPKKRDFNNLLVQQHSYLLKTKLAIVEHIKLDPEDAQYELYKNQLENRINQVRQDGQTNLQKFDEYQDLQELKLKTRDIYQEQEYSVNYLVDLSNLLKEYSRLIEQYQDHIFPSKHHLQ